MAMGPLLTLTLGVTLSLLTTAHCGVLVVGPDMLNGSEQETVSVVVNGPDGRPSVTITIQAHAQVHDTVSSVVIPDHCAPCYGYVSVSSNAIPPLDTTHQLWTRACTQTYKMDYVHVGQVMYSKNQDGELKHTFLIQNVTKPGTESREVLIGNDRVYVVPSNCPPCGMEQGRRFLIMGHERPNQKVYGVPEYTLTPSSYAVPLYSKYEARSLTFAERRTNKIHKNFIKNFRNCGI